MSHTTPVSDGSPATRPLPLVLVAEDDRDTREIYRACLDMSGFCTAEAHNGRQALAKATELVPDVLITDLALPGLDGFELCRQIRQNARTSHIPIIAITGYAFADLQTRAQRAGMDRVIIKPCLPDTLVREVRRMLARPKGAKEGAVQPPRPERRNVARREAIVKRVRAEFEEFPGLQLSVGQAKRLFDLSEDGCSRVFELLVRQGFLQMTNRGTYLRRD